MRTAILTWVLTGLSVPALAMDWSNTLEAALGVEVRPTKTVGPGVYVVEPELTSASEQVRLDVVATKLGHFTSDRTPQALLFVREHDPKRLPELRCLAVVAEQSIHDDELAWDSISAISWLPEACAGTLEVEVDETSGLQLPVVTGCKGELKVRDGRLEAGPTTAFRRRVDFAESPPWTTEADGAAPDCSELDPDVVFSVSRRGELRTAFQWTAPPESLHPEWDVRLVADLATELEGLDYTLEWDAQSHARTITTTRPDVAAKARVHLGELGWAYRENTLFSHRPDGVLRLEKTVVLGPPGG